MLVHGENIESFTIFSSSGASPEPLCTIVLWCWKSFRVVFNWAPIWCRDTPDSRSAYSYTQTSLSTTTDNFFVAKMTIQILMHWQKLCLKNEEFELTMIWTFRLHIVLEDRNYWKEIFWCKPWSRCEQLNLKWNRSFSQCWILNRICRIYLRKYAEYILHETEITSFRWCIWNRICRI